jgi:hypothetical protein
MTKDFHELRSRAESEGFFKPSVPFFVFIMAHILFFDFLGWWIMRSYGTGWLSYVIAAFFLTIGQVIICHFICNLIITKLFSVLKQFFPALFIIISLKKQIRPIVGYLTKVKYW